MAKKGDDIYHCHLRRRPLFHGKIILPNYCSKKLQTYTRAGTFGGDGGFTDKSDPYGISVVIKLFGFGIFSSFVIYNRF